MTKAEIMHRLRQVGLIPVIRAESADEALRAVAAITAGGIPVLEITMTVPGAVSIIGQVAERYGTEAIIGAGTVLDAETARACLLAGAQFIVSPALSLETIACCRRYSIPVMPGALTPTEVVTAWQAGADLVKVFPCQAVGGASYIKALKAPLPQIELVPTGGVSLVTAADFLRAGASALGVGADLVDTKALRQGEDQVITARARQYVEIVNEVRRETKG
jgi:2-dehydro-3-deoxyphosphogluconate aldolase/(4S)-4-hydroxy-2-oxoglutarate aldolase